MPSWLRCKSSRARYAASTGSLLCSTARAALPRRGGGQESSCVEWRICSTRSYLVQLAGVTNGRPPQLFRSVRAPRLRVTGVGSALSCAARPAWSSAACPARRPEHHNRESPTRTRRRNLPSLRSPSAPRTLPPWPTGFRRWMRLMPVNTTYMSLKRIGHPGHALTCNPARPDRSPR